METGQRVGCAFSRATMERCSDRKEFQRILDIIELYGCLDIVSSWQLLKCFNHTRSTVGKKVLCEIHLEFCHSKYRALETINICLDTSS